MNKTTYLNSYKNFKGRSMQTALLHSDSSSDLKLLLDIAKKIGIKAKILSKSEIEDIGLFYAIQQGKTGEYTDTDSYLNKLRQ